jgi:hypothetical protein
MKGVDSGAISPVQAEAQLQQIGMTKGDVSQLLGEYVTKIFQMPIKP